MTKIISAGIDIGGTKANIGIIDEEGKVLISHRLDVIPEESAEALIVRLGITWKELLKSQGYTGKEIRSVGIGVPGTVDSMTGMVEYCPNLGWEDIPAGILFRKALDTEVIITQDSRAAAWAEYLLGAGRGARSMVCVTIGTGIGCGIVIDGKIFHGAMNTAGELGHTIFSQNGRHCNCGLDGCLERYCSGTGIFERAFESFPEMFDNRPHRAETVFYLARQNNADMLKVIQESVIDLSIGIANLVSILSPEMVIISGGLCEYEDLIIQPLREWVYTNGYHSWSRKKQLQIVKAELGPSAPMIGAGLLYKDV